MDKQKTIMETLFTIDEEELKEFRATEKKFPKSIQEEIKELIYQPETAITTERETDILFEKLKDLWDKGNIYNNMVRIAEETGADLETLTSLDAQSQLAIDFEYDICMAEGRENEAVDSVFRNIEELSPLRELQNVEKFLEFDSYELSTLPRKYKLQICEAYAENYEKGGDNSKLLEELKRILEEAQKEAEEVTEEDVEEFF